MCPATKINIVVFIHTHFGITYNTLRHCKGQFSFLFFRSFNPYGIRFSCCKAHDLLLTDSFSVGDVKQIQ